SAHVPLVNDTFPTTSLVQNSYSFHVDAQNIEQGSQVSNSSLHGQHGFTSVNRSQAAGDVQHAESVSQTHEPDPSLGAASASVQPVVEPPAYPESFFLWGID
ncbi:hypothetical protein V6N11_083001, partial [Hibiscus sabdariffa]